MALKMFTRKLLPYVETVFILFWGSGAKLAKVYTYLSRLSFLKSDNIGKLLILPSLFTWSRKTLLESLNKQKWGTKKRFSGNFPWKSRKRVFLQLNQIAGKIWRSVFQRLENVLNVESCSWSAIDSVSHWEMHPLAAGVFKKIF